MSEHLSWPASIAMMAMCAGLAFAIVKFDKYRAEKRRKQLAAERLRVLHSAPKHQKSAEVKRAAVDAAVRQHKRETKPSCRYGTNRPSRTSDDYATHSAINYSGDSSSSSSSCSSSSSFSSFSSFCD